MDRRIAPLLFASLALPSPAFAQSEADLAERLAADAEAAFKQNRYEEASRKARASYSLDRDVKTVCLLGNVLYACWDYQSNCTGEGIEADRAEAIARLGQCVRELEAVPALARRHRGSIEMAQNHQLELEQAPPAATSGKGSPRQDTLLSQKRRADRAYDLWRNASLTDEQRSAARARARARYEDLLALLREPKGEPGDEESNMNAEAKRRLAELKGTRPAVTPVPPTPTPAASPPVYKRAWFWAIMGPAPVAIAAGVTLGVLLSPTKTPPVVDLSFP